MSVVLHIFIELDYHIFYIDEYSTIFVDKITLFIHKKNITRVKSYNVCYDDKPTSPRDNVNRKNVMNMFLESSEQKYIDADADIKDIEGNWRWKNDGYMFDDVMDTIENFFKNKCIVLYTYDSIILQRILSRNGINVALSLRCIGNILCIVREEEIDEIDFRHYITDKKELFLSQRTLMEQ